MMNKTFRSWLVGLSTLILVSGSFSYIFYEISKIEKPVKSDELVLTDKERSEWEHQRKQDPRIHMNMKTPKKFVERNEKITVEVEFTREPWYQVDWNIRCLDNNNPPQGLVLRLEDEYVLTITNNAKTFFDFSIGIEAVCGKLKQYESITIKGMEMENFVESNMPKSYIQNIKPVTEEEILEEKVSSLSIIAKCKNNGEFSAKIKSIEENTELTNEEKQNEIDKLAAEKHINLIDKNVLQEQKNESIQRTYDEILLNEDMTDGDKYIFLKNFNSQVDTFFAQTESCVTNDELNEKLKQYVQGNEQIKSNATEVIDGIDIGEFINNNQLLRNNEQFYAQDFYLLNFEEESCKQNTELLNPYFSFFDYFDTFTYGLSDTIKDNWEIHSQINNLSNDDKEINFNIRYSFFNLTTNSYFSQENEKVEVTAIFFLPFLDNGPEYYTIDEFASLHSFSLNQDACWDNLCDNYFYKSLKAKTDLSKQHYSTYCSRPGTWGYENWDVRDFYSDAENITSELVFNPINDSIIESISNKTVSQLKQENIIKSFNWQIEMKGEGNVYYDSVPFGETGYGFSHSAILTNINPTYDAIAVNKAPAEDGVESHRLYWNASINENSVYLRRNGNEFYLYFSPECIQISNYFYGGSYENGPANNWKEGGLSNTSNLLKTTIPYDLNLMNIDLTDLLLIDNKQYEQSDFPQFEMSIVLNDLTFDQNNPDIINDLVYAKIKFQVKIKDLVNDTVKIFDQQESLLLKNVTTDMIQSQINRLIDDAKVFMINIDKFEQISNLILAHEIFAVSIQTGLIILQVINVAKIASSVISMNFVLLSYFIAEALIYAMSYWELLGNIEETINTYFFNKEFLAIVNEIKNYFYFNNEELMFDLSQIENITTNNDKYIKILELNKKWDFSNITNWFNEAVKIELKKQSIYEKDLNDIANLSNGISGHIATKIIKKMLGLKTIKFLGVNINIFFIGFLIAKVANDLAFQIALEIIDNTNTYETIFDNIFHAFHR